MVKIGEFKNNTTLIEKINANVADLWQAFDNIISLRNDPLCDDSCNTAFQNFVTIIDLVPLMATTIDIPNVVRGQENTTDEPIFSAESRISYNLQRMDLIEFGRFNQKGEPLFYGSLPTESKNIDYVLSCALECCKEITQNSGNFRYKDITVGGWKVKQSFEAINLCFDEDHLQENPSLKDSIQDYLNEMSECVSPSAYHFIKSFMEYFSNLSGSLALTPFHYFAPTALFHAIRWYYSEKAKEPKFGLIYPGAMSEKRGLNIVLTRDAVDSCLSLEKVVMFRYCPVKPENTTYVAHPCSDLVYPKNGIFRITGYVSPGMN